MWKLCEGVVHAQWLRVENCVVVAEYEIEVDWAPPGSGSEEGEQAVAEDNPRDPADGVQKPLHLEAVGNASAATPLAAEHERYTGHCHEKVNTDDDVSGQSVHWNRDH